MMPIHFLINHHTIIIKKKKKNQKYDILIFIKSIKLIRK